MHSFSKEFRKKVCMFVFLHNFYSGYVTLFPYIYAVYLFLIQSFVFTIHVIKTMPKLKDIIKSEMRSKKSSAFKFHKHCHLCIIEQIVLKVKQGPGAVAQACNPSTLGG